MRLPLLLAFALLPAAETRRRCPSYGLEECAGVGTCDETDGTCVCPAGRASFDCAVVVACDPAATRLPCSGHGVCDAAAAGGGGACRCAPGFSGVLCQTDDWCPRDAIGRPCSNAGVCSNHVCICPEHRKGVACEMGDPSSRGILPAAATAAAAATTA